MPVNEICSDSPSDRIESARRSSSSPVFQDAYSGLSDTAGKLTRVASLLTVGTTAGAIREVERDPLGYSARAATAFVVGTGLGPVVVAVPFVAGVATGATVLYGLETVNPFDPKNQERYANIGNAIRDTWQHSDRETFERSMNTMQEAVGPLTLDLSLIAVGAKGVKFGARHINVAPGSQSLAPQAVPAFYGSRPVFGRSRGFDPEATFFHVRHGKVTVNAGPPETVDARLEMMDFKHGLNKFVPQKRNGASLVDHIVPPPPDRQPQNLTVRPFHFNQKHSLYYQ